MMIAMLDTSDDLTQAEAELGCPVGELLTPLTRRLRHSTRPFAIDNGCFASFNEAGFLSLLERERQSQGCKFVVAPDIVASARRTLEVFPTWQRKIACLGYKVALAAQDGLENLTIPWSRVGALFIGGTTEWKMGKAAADCVRTAKLLGKWVHVGRINTPERYEHFLTLGADSFDGSGISQYTHMREAIRDAYKHPQLFPPASDLARKVVYGDSGGLVGAASVVGQIRANEERRDEVV